MNISIKNKLNKLLKKCDEHTINHLGYPYNLNCDQYNNLAPFLKYFINNLGDSFEQSNYKIDSREFEHEILDYFANLWNINKTMYWGYVTSCGTEGNLLGILYGREYLINPILISSKDSHYSIYKSCKMFKIPYHPIDSDETGEINYNSLDNYINNLSITTSLNNIKLLIVANIGTTITGAHDQVKKILTIINKYNIPRTNYYIHCDAALSGCILPLIEEASKYKFGFDNDVDSISVSGHKFLGTPIPCGVVITKKQYMENWSTNIEYINSSDTTIGGSRSGFAIIALWLAIMNKTSEEFISEYYTCLDNADYLIELFNTKKIKAWRNPFSIIVIFPKPNQIIINKYQLACQDNISHIVVTPSVTKQILKQFIDEYY